VPEIKNMKDTQSTEYIAAPSIGAAPLTSGALLARNATLNLATEGWTFVVLLIAMPKLVAYLGETSFGLFSLAWVVIGYLAFACRAPSVPDRWAARARGWRPILGA
jgi:hypothetical protein